MQEKELKEAYSFANYAASVHRERENLREWLDHRLTISMDGGTFRIDSALISLVTALLAHGDHETVILMDMHGQPIEIKKPSEFKDSIISRYHESMREYHSKYESLRKSRSVKAVVTR